ncbi:hypothetical protein Glove_261g22 [Diversispora epigaea]|uniref:Uncharacterized protein n=1 Tax=Diversispora epigaea TaxID=1348612 RepID=A0A397IEM1_9GLOM|nr:hypothetical protein Glove_261g22 [Diversispora epigaea]
MTTRPPSTQRPGYTVVVIDNSALPPLPPPPNWPRCYPIIYHDIETDFGEESTRRILRRSYLLFKFYVATLVAYSIANIVIAITFGDANEIIIQVISSILYLLILSFGDFLGRHLSLYFGFKTNLPSMFRYYFFGEAIVFFFILIVSIGFLNIQNEAGVVKLFENKFYVAGIFTSIFLLFAIVQTILHLILISQVYKHFRSQGFRICAC